jgi:transmembrane sensor
MAEQNHNRDVREVAAEWHDRVTRDKVTHETRVAFSQWLDASAENRDAYEAVERTWARVSAAGNDPNILALRHEAALRLQRKPSRPKPILQLAAGVAGLLLFGGFFLALSGAPIVDSFLGPGASGTYATQLGERLAVTLSDGTQVTLNTNSSLRVAFTGAERRVDLLRGQALFEVAKNPTRPFVVQTPNRRFVAVGTAFDVRLDGEEVRVTMLEGTVRVEHPPAPDSDGRLDAGPDEITLLTAGEQLIVDQKQSDRVQVADAERVTSWRRGQVIFEDSRLEDAVSELNRYSATRIVLQDPDLAELRISGAFATGRPAVFVQAMTAYFPLSANPQPDDTIVLGWRKDSAQAVAR